jgi:hypothetical protein
MAILLNQVVHTSRRLTPPAGRMAAFMTSIKYDEDFQVGARPYEIGGPLQWTSKLETEAG